MKKLRLLVTKECNRNCPGCCNKLWNLDELPVCKSFEGYDEVILTGGEPMLFPHVLLSTIVKIHAQNPLVKVYVHTAHYDISEFFDIYEESDGITFTIHEQEDVKKFINLNSYIREFPKNYRSLRLYLMPNIKLPSNINLSHWQIKNKTYDKECPLPKDEVFMRLQ